MDLCGKFLTSASVGKLMNDKKIPTSKWQRGAITGMTTARIGLKHLGHLGSTALSREKVQKQALHEAEIGKILINAFMQLRGTALKVAQMMSMELDMLPDAIRRELAKACSQVTPLNRAHIRKVFLNEFGQAPEQVFKSFEADAFAAASLGQVHRAVLKSGEIVAVKIQYPGIAASIRNDVQLVRGIMKTVSKGTSYLPDWEIIDSVLNDVQAQLEQEVNYVQEAANTDWFRQKNQMPSIHIPLVYEDYSSEKILVTQLMPGKHIDAWLEDEPEQEARNHYGQLLMNMFSHHLYDLGVLHADPHPGNFLFNPEQGISLLDFGCIQKLKPGFPQTLVKLCTRDPEKIFYAYQTQGIIRQDLSFEEFEHGFFPLIEPIQNWMSMPFQTAEFDFALLPPMPQKHTQNMKYAVKQVGEVRQDQVFFDRSFLGLLSLLRRMKAKIVTQGLLRDN